jgi:hypothetical protein
VCAGEAPTDEYWSSTRARVADAYKAKAAVGRAARFADAASPVDAESTVWATNKPMGPPRLRADGVPDGRRQVIPTLYCPWERLDKSDELLVAFAALAVAQEARFTLIAAQRVATCPGQ